MKTSLLKSHWDKLNREQILDLQFRQFKTFLAETVLPFSAHYRNVFKKNRLTLDDFQTLDHLRYIPFTSKKDLMNTPECPQKAREFVIIPDKAVLSKRPSTILNAILHGRSHVAKEFEKEFRPVFMTSTTGRSADPIPFVYSDHDMQNLMSCGKRLFEVCGAKPEYRLLNMFPYAPHLAFWLTHYGGTEFGVFTVGTGGGKVMGTEGNLRMIQKIQPDGLIGMPTFIYHVLSEGAAKGIRCEKLSRIVLGGEKVPDGMRKKLRHLAGELGAKEISIVATYGFTEAKAAWGECSFPEDGLASGYHLYPDHGIFEVINPKTLEVVPEGTPGELVFTSINSRGSVVLRYRTGDYIDGGLFYEPCPYCHRMCPRLLGNISRSSEIKEIHLDKVKGTLVDFNQLEHVLDNADHIGAWQVEIRKVHDDPLELDELIAHVEKVDSIDEKIIVQDLNNRFVAQTELRPNRILFHSAEEMRQLQGVGVQMKEQKIIDNRPRLLS